MQVRAVTVSVVVSFIVLALLGIFLFLRITSWSRRRSEERRGHAALNAAPKETRKGMFGQQTRRRGKNAFDITEPFVKSNKYGSLFLLTMIQGRVFQLRVWARSTSWLLLLLASLRHDPLLSGCRLTCLASVVGFGPTRLELFDFCPSAGR